MLEKFGKFCGEKLAGRVDSCFETSVNLICMKQNINEMSGRTCTNFPGLSTLSPSRFPRRLENFGGNENVHLVVKTLCFRETRPYGFAALLTFVNV